MWSMFKHTDKGFMRCFTGIYHPLGFCILTRAARRSTAELSVHLKSPDMSLFGSITHLTRIHSLEELLCMHIWLGKNTNLTSMFNWLKTQLKDIISFGCLPIHPRLSPRPLISSSFIEYYVIETNSNNSPTLREQCLKWKRTWEHDTEL